MDITFAALDLPADHAALMQFTLSNEFPFHVNARPSRTDLERKISDGAFGGPDHASFWVQTESEGRIGLVILEDLLDDAPLFDLRLSAAARGRRLGAPILRALTAEVFQRWPNINRFEGQTREDNIAMRKTFLRSGFIKEAHYREGWPVTGSHPLASVAYAILRHDWVTGETTNFVWEDLTV
ncbi:MULTISPECIES: GNAT family protein [Cryobacterium]|uniref:N-acetyltransferase n=1 Tax=Cryobacterium breve TaxID=1259258 RepID=A0ABY2JAI4_9MICO|nr:MULTISPECIES: GNAT family protein [Cryobacterium]TFC94486.1 N-acetyltransferase [Cryobacterium sp. TmT3-12]TFD01962.1 N-acetyltransferase [Cryobacterium breve]